MSDITIRYLGEHTGDALGAMDDVGVYEVAQDTGETFTVRCGVAAEFEGPFPLDGRPRAILRRWETGELSDMLADQGSPVTFGATNVDLG